MVLEMNQDGVVSAVIKLLAEHLMSNHGSIPSRGGVFICLKRYLDLLWRSLSLLFIVYCNLLPCW
jgi:hypothetical protein